MKKWKPMIILLLCAVCTFGISCGRERMSAEEILWELNGLCEEAPAGAHYLSGTEEGDEAYLSPTVRDALYGEESEEIFQRVEEYAVYLSSFAAPYEIAVFRCYSATDANRVAAMCLERADQLRVALHGTGWEALADTIQVACQGRYVVMSMTDQPKTVQKEALRLIG